MNNYYVYIHRRKDNKTVFYVGISRQEKYFRVNTKTGRNPIWNNIVNKYGFTGEVLLSELGQMLHYENLPYFSKEYDMWMLPKESVLNGQGLGSINECEIRAMLLIYVLENKLMSVNDVNDRLSAESIA